MDEIRASVAMAVYNGERYINEQIDSIIERMGRNDELVISYDRSTDRTKEIIDGYAAADERVKVVENTGPGGVQNNFTNAVMNCRGRYIFLADQDDVWIGDKINVVVEKFKQTDADLVVHNGYMTDGDLNIAPATIFDQYGRYDNPVRNIIKCNYWGCCMAFQSRIKDMVCPFPNRNRVGHDWWIGIQVGFYGKIVRIEDCLMMHRVHGSNQSEVKRRPLIEIMCHRLTLIGYLLKYAFSSGKGK